MQNATSKLFARQWASPIIVVCLTLLVVYWATAIVVLAVDPFRIFPWGRPRELDFNNRADDKKFLFASVAKNPDIDLLMIGSSTAEHYIGDDLKAAFPSAKHPYNLSYGAARPFDRGLAIKTVAKFSSAQHIIIWLDYPYALSEHIQTEAFPAYMYDDGWFDKLRVVNETSVIQSLRLLRRLPLFGDYYYQQRLAEYDAQEPVEYTTFQSSSSRRELARLVDKFKDIIDRPGVSSCSELPSFQLGLLPQLRNWSSQGKLVDLVFPAYSPAFYYARGERGSGMKLADQLMLRRCVVIETQPLANVRVTALDGDANFTGDLKNFKDPGHLFGQGPLIKALEDIAGGRFLITAENLEEYLSELHRRVVHYRPDLIQP